MSYIANKVCRFAGHDFLKGEVVPDELVLKSKVPDLIKTGVLVEAPQEEKVLFTIPIKTDDGEIILNFNSDEIYHIIDYLGKSSDEAKAVIDSIISNDVLIVLDRAEHRKTIKEYIKNRALQLIEESQE